MPEGKKKEKILGIDLGTSNSAAAVMIGGKPEIIPAAEGVSVGGKAFPSYVAFTTTERLVGDAAKNQVAMNPHNTVFDAKRLIGRKYNDKSVQNDMKHWSFKVVPK